MIPRSGYFGRGLRGGAAVARGGGDPARARGAGLEQGFPRPGNEVGRLERVGRVAGDPGRHGDPDVAGGLAQPGLDPFDRQPGALLGGVVERSDDDDVADAARAISLAQRNSLSSVQARGTSWMFASNCCRPIHRGIGPAFNTLSMERTMAAKKKKATKKGGAKKKK